MVAQIFTIGHADYGNCSLIQFIRSILTYKILTSLFCSTYTITIFKPISDVYECMYLPDKVASWPRKVNVITANAKALVSSSDPWSSTLAVKYCTLIFEAITLFAFKCPLCTRSSIHLRTVAGLVCIFLIAIYPLTFELKSPPVLVYLCIECIASFLYWRQTLNRIQGNSLSY